MGSIILGIISQGGQEEIEKKDYLIKPVPININIS